MTSFAHPTLREFHPSRRPAPGGLGQLVSRTAATLRLWRTRVHQKHLLAQLGERDWHDMGVSQSDVYAELNRPFWRAPPPC